MVIKYIYSSSNVTLQLK